MRTEAAEGLGELKAYKALHDHALHDAAVAVRTVAVEWLGKMNQPQLLATALNDETVELRLRTVNLLDELQTPAPLARAARHDPEPRVRSNAMEALARLKQVDALADGPLRDPVETIARRAVDLLGALRSTSSLGHVALADGQRPEIRLAAANWLVQLRAPRELLPALQDPEMDVRLVATEGMGQMVSEINSTDGSEDAARKSRFSARGSSRMGGAANPGDGFDLRLHVMEALVGLLADTKPQLRHAAAKSLALLGDSDWEGAFPKADGGISLDAMLASERPEIEEILVNLLTVERPEDRRDAAKLIGLRRDADSAAALRVAAGDRDGSVRVQAVRALGELKDEDGVHIVVEALEDRSAQVRHQAVVAAGLIGAVAAAKPVIARLDDKQELVAAAASAVLYTMQCEESLAALLSCLVHASPKVLVGAVASLSRWAPARRAMIALTEANLLGPKALSAHKLRAEAKAAACEVGDTILRLSFTEDLSAPLIHSGPPCPSPSTADVPTPLIHRSSATSRGAAPSPPTTRTT